MKQQSLSSRLTYGRPILLSEITSQYGRRPYGVGLLVAGVDAKGPHLFEFQPSGITQEMVACGIGARSQMARTYLERNLDQFEGSSREELIKHALRALNESLPQDKELTVDNTSLGVSGMDENFTLYEGQQIAQWLDTTFENRNDDAGDGAAAAPAADAPAQQEGAGESMEVDS
jgi:20S proteasome subunit alpha 6